MSVTFQLCTKALQAKQNADEAGTTFLSPQSILFVDAGLSLHKDECQQCLLHQHEGGGGGALGCFLRSSSLRAVTPKLFNRILALMQRYIYTLCFAGRQIIPTERKVAGQSSRGLDKGTRELM